jgi:hypothetical protein
VVGTGPRIQSVVARSLPTRLRDGVLRGQTGVPKSR